MRFYLKYIWLGAISFGFGLMPDITIPFGNRVFDFSWLSGLFLGIFLGFYFKERKRRAYLK